MAGFAAQLVDGALGMAYGVIGTTLLLSLGVPPVIASASIHVAEIFTTGISGLSHAIFKNINKKIFKYLAIPGVIGGILGAALLAKIPAAIAKLIISIYLLLMGIFILFKAIRFRQRTAKANHEKALVPLGLIGGFLDVVGGGGWGPVVTSSLIVLGINPRYAVGTTNLVEFLVAVSSSAVFIFILGVTVTAWNIVLGLLVGGMLAAPLAAYVTRVMPTKFFTFLIGFLIVLLSARMIFQMIYS